MGSHYGHDRLVLSSKAEDGLTPADRRRNFRLGVINGTVFRVTMTAIDSHVVLTWFLAQLGVSNFVIGLVSPIRMGSSFLLQIPVSGYLQQRRYKLPFYRWMAVVRCAVLIAIALVIALVPVHSRWLLRAFFALLIAYSLGAGLTGISFMDVVAKVVAATRRGSFFAQRSFWGGTLTLGASALVGFVLAEPDGLRFPLNISLLFIVAAVTLAVAAGVWSLVKEPPSPLVGRDVRWTEQAGRGVRLLVADPPFRRYALWRYATQLAQSAAPFYVVYAKTVLGVSAQMLGVYLAARTAATILTNLFWGRISDRMGNRRLIQLTNVVGLAMPLAALLVGLLVAMTAQPAPWIAWAYGLVFVGFGAFTSGANIARPGYLLDLAPPAQRPLYLGFSNTLFGIGTFTTLVGGLVVDWAGFSVLFVCSACLFAIALLLSLLMVEPRQRDERAQTRSTALGESRT